MKIWSCEGVGEPLAHQGAPKGLFDHILGNRRYFAKGLISEKGRSPSMNSKIVM
jgi:hypothetical protein